MTVTKEDFLTALPPYVVQHGWSVEALNATAAACRITPLAQEILFPNGITDVIRAWSHQTDAAVVARTQRVDFAALRTSDKIAALLMARLQALAPQREMVVRLLHYFTIPTRWAFKQELLFSTCNRLWYLAGDKAADFNFYTKRLLLMGVYSSALLFWLTDESPDYVETAAFIQRRLQEVALIGKASGQVKAFVQRVVPQAGASVS